MEVQVFGIKNDADTRKALRFFKERRVKVHFMDFKQRNPSKGELRRFFERFGDEVVPMIEKALGPLAGIGAAPAAAQ